MSNNMEHHKVLSVSNDNNTTMRQALVRFITRKIIDVST